MKTILVSLVLFAVPAASFASGNCVHRNGMIACQTDAGTPAKKTKVSKKSKASAKTSSGCMKINGVPVC